jgi:TonB family protein
MFVAASKPAGRHRSLAVLAGLALTVAVAGGGAYLSLSRSRAATGASRTGSVSPAAAALARVRELEARVAELEGENAALEAALAGAGRAPVSGASPASPERLAEVDDPDVVQPTLLREGPPLQYPPEAASRGRRARVIVEALVGEDGTVLETRAVESSIPGLGFEAAAERRVEAGLYRPATKRGVPVRVRIRVPVEFVP